MYLFVFMYLFIYLPHDHYGNCNSELCLSAKKNVKGGWQNYKRNKRLCGRDKKRLKKRKIEAEVTSASYKSYILENICNYFL